MRLEALVDSPRVQARSRAEVRTDGSCVLYWMQRSQRARDNPALDLAIRVGNLLGKPILVLVTFALPPWAGRRHVHFFAEGLAEIADALAERGVGFLLRGPEQEVEEVAAAAGACLVVGDENPVRWAERARERLARRVPVPLLTVDADVVVPTAVIGREHWAARTIRPRIHEQLDQFLVKERSPPVKVRWSARRAGRLASLDPRALDLDRLGGRGGASAVTSFRGGSREARARLRRFLRERLDGYATHRNRPEVDGTSQLSPYLHFGHIGPREVALAVVDASAPKEDRDAFLEELIVRRELAVGFVRYNDRYDRLDGCERWARETLKKHSRDPRELLPARLLAAAESPDPLWNAAQAQMLELGWMHGYMRMYWAKRLLEWTRSPEEAFALAIRFNDENELDGGDPNGYAGVAWAIGGKHDQAFGERPIFGKVRFMSAASTGRKFDGRAYVQRHAPGSEGAAYGRRRRRGRVRAG